jgi:hypothetical protein
MISISPIGMERDTLIKINLVDSNFIRIFNILGIEYHLYQRAHLY